MQRPDVLVLGAGGTIGAAWMSGVLAGIAAETGIDFTAADHIVGTSAGSMVAADLLAGVEPRPIGDGPAGGEAADGGRNGRGATGGPDGDGPLIVGDGSATADGDAREPLRGRILRAGGGAASALGTRLAPFALSAARPAGTIVRAAALARIEPRTAALEDLRVRIDGHGLRFDGRLRVVCVDRERGGRVVFGAPGAPEASVAEAVQASCSVPWVNRPVTIGEREYVDGAVWSPTNMDAAPAGRDTHLLCLAPLAGQLGSDQRSRGVWAATATAIAVETAALRRRGVQLRVVAPEPRDPREHARVTGWRQGRALARGA